MYIYIKVIHIQRVGGKGVGYVYLLYMADSSIWIKRWIKKSMFFWKKKEWRIYTTGSIHVVFFAVLIFNNVWQEVYISAICETESLLYIH